MMKIFTIPSLLTHYDVLSFHWFLVFLKIVFYFLKIFIYLFILRRREGKREGEKHQCVVASCAPPTRNPAHNPGMCPRLGIKLEALWFPGQHSIHWATPGRSDFCILLFISIKFCSLQCGELACISLDVYLGIWCFFIHFYIASFKILNFQTQI